MKKIRQWSLGFALSWWGMVNVLCGFVSMLSLANVIDSTGKECIGYFLLFIITLFVFLFSPYALFKTLQNGLEI